MSTRTASDGIPREASRHVGRHCLCLHVQRAARALSRRFDEAFRPLGLTSGQFSLLMTLNRPDPPAMGELARFLAMDRTTLSAALKPLERRRLVGVRRDPADRRTRRVRLTPAGRRVLARALPIWEATHAELEAGLAALAPDRLRAALRGISDEISDPIAAPIADPISDPIADESRPAGADGARGR